jgi:hypothetical protein
MKSLCSMPTPSSREVSELERGVCSLGIGVCERLSERERNAATRKQRRRKEERRRGRETVVRVCERKTKCGREKTTFYTIVGLQQAAAGSMFGP